MNIDEHKLEYLNVSHQFIIIDAQFHILESCNSLVELNDQYNQSIFDLMPLLESFRHEIAGMKAGNGLSYPCISTTLLGIQSTFDLSFRQTDEFTVMVIIDRKGDYEYLQLLQQERNQSIIEKEVTENEAKMKSRFLANMSHEFRTPMNSMIGFANLILESKDLSEEDREFANNILISSKSLLVLINDILDLSKMEAGHLNIEVVTFDLVEMLDDLRKIFYSQCKDRNISIRINYGDDVPSIIKSDPVRLNQILTNLISNAMKFSDDGGEIVVDTKVNTAENRIVLEVIDNGIGIEPDKLEKIFKSFAQEEDSTTRIYGGTGLGLSIVKKLTSLLDGTVAVSSQKGEGSTFSVELPLIAGSAEDLERERDIDEIPNLQSLAGMKLLVAEDNKMNQILITKILETAGVDMTLVQNGQEAVEIAEQRKYDAILMDVQMPVMDGFDATTKIKANNSINSNTPIIAMTARSFKEDIEECYNAGMTGYISKPFELEILISVILTQVRPEGNRT